MISRRLLLGTAAAAALTCVGSATAVAQIEIQWWHAMGGQLGEALNALAEGFNKSQKDYKVVPVYKGTYTETMTGAIAAFRAKQQPHIVQVFEVGTATMMAAKGAIYPVHQLMVDAGETVRSQRISAGGLRLLLDDGRQAPVDAVQLLDARALLQQGRIQESRPRPQATENLVGHGATREEAPGRRLPSAASPASGRPGYKSRISARGTTFHLRPGRTGSPGRTSSSRSTIRCGSVTSRTSPNGRRRRSSSMPAARVSRTRNSPPASAR